MSTNLRVYMTLLRHYIPELAESIVAYLGERHDYYILSMAGDGGGVWITAKVKSAINEEGVVKTLLHSKKNFDSVFKDILVSDLSFYGIPKDYTADVDEYFELPKDQQLKVYTFLREKYSTSPGQFLKLLEALWSNDGILMKILMKFIIIRTDNPLYRALEHTPLVSESRHRKVLRSVD